MRTFNTIVCALDLHPFADRALTHVAALARGRGVGIELVTVVDETVRPASVIVELEQRAERFGLQRSELVVIHSESPGGEIGDHVSGRDGTLLVIATTAHGGRDEHQLGTVTDEVLRRTRQPVMVVGPRAVEAAGCLVVATDDAETAGAAMPVVERWLATFGDREVRIVEVRAPDAWPERAPDAPAPWLDRYVDQLGACGITAVGEVVRGFDPVVSVVDGIAGTDVAMIVVTSPSDPGQPTHWFRTARRLIRFAPRPVLVVPAEQPSPWSPSPRK